MLLTYFTKEDQLKLGVTLLTNQIRKEEMMRVIEYLILRHNFTNLTNLGPLVLYLFDNSDNDQNAHKALDVALSVIKDLYSINMEQNIINVFGDEVTEDNVIVDLYKLFFVILTPWFNLLRDEFDHNIFSKYESSGRSGTYYASNLAAKILLYFSKTNIKRARSFFIGKYGKATTFNLSELNQDIKNNIVLFPEAIDNIDMDMVKTLPDFIAHHKSLLKQNTAKNVMSMEAKNFSFDFNAYIANFNSGSKDALAHVKLHTKKCTSCTEKDKFMMYFSQVAINVYYMFSAIKAYKMQKMQENRPLAFSTTLQEHNFQFFDIPPECKCLSLDRLNYRNLKIGTFILDLKIRPIRMTITDYQNTEALAYIMDIVLANNQLRQTPEKRVFKITREMWLEFLSLIEKRGTYANAAAKYNNANEYEIPVFNEDYGYVVVDPSDDNSVANSNSVGDGNSNVSVANSNSDVSDDNSSYVSRLSNNNAYEGNDYELAN